MMRSEAGDYPTIQKLTGVMFSVSTWYTCTYQTID